MEKILSSALAEPCRTGTVLSGLLAFIGVALIAIPTSIIAGGFIEAATTKKSGE
jgi:hypothetical protein